MDRLSRRPDAPRERHAHGGFLVHRVETLKDSALQCGAAFTVIAILLLAQMALSGDFTANDGVAVAYAERGTGEPLMLLAGGPGLTPEYMDPVAERLSEQYRCILLHQRGTGRSALPSHGQPRVTL